MGNKDSEVESILSDQIVVGKKDDRCAPTLEFTDKSCIPLNLLIEMAKAYNKSFKQNQIKLHKNINAMETLNPTKYKRYLLKEFSEKFKKECDNQRCWIKQGFLKNAEESIQEKLKENVHRPEGPEGKWTWLNTININEVMEQYEDKYKDFKFLGAVPIDFDELEPLGIANLDFKKLKSEGKTKLGIVFNLDEHFKGGSHWVAGYTDLNKNQVYFFDSYGVEPEQRIRTFLRRCTGECDFTKVKKGGSNKSDIQHNKIRHQQKGSECGVYSINFILRLLKGETFDEITNNITLDEEVNKCRKVYFT
jgi:hypothetical protein